MSGAGAQSTVFSDALRKAISLSGKTLGSLSEQLLARGYSVSVSALSHWSSGRRRPERPESVDAVVELEDILGLAPGELSELLGGPRHRGRSPRTVDFAARVPERERFMRALRVLNFDDVRIYPHLQSVQCHTFVGADRAPRRYEFTHVYRAMADGPVRFTNIQFVPGPPICDFSGRDNDFFVDLDGATLGRTIAWPEDNLVGAEFLVADEGRRGENYVVKYAIALPKDYYLEATEFSSVRRVRESVLAVTFDGEVPEEIIEFDQNGDEVRGRNMTPNKHVVSLHQDTGPGVIGVKWRWPETDAPLTIEAYPAAR